jgi:Na+-transporting NADH:ubiquinone oxidoreductase subunit C
VLCAGALAGVFEALKSEHKKQEALDTKKQILSAVIEIEGIKGSEIEKLYTESINALVVNNNGDKIDGVDPQKVNVLKEFKKKDVSQKQFPVFIYSDSGGKKSYILPVYGNGLWDAVWGFVALDGDMNTLKGISFGHKGETPGLGARITNKDVRERFIGKQIFEASGVLAGVYFQKGEKNDYSNEPHKVDGLAGASMTTDGVNSMLKSYFGYYQSYFNSIKNADENTVLNDSSKSLLADSSLAVSETFALLDSTAVMSSSLVVDSTKISE